MRRASAAVVLLVLALTLCAAAPAPTVHVTVDGPGLVDAPLLAWITCSMPAQVLDDSIHTNKITCNTLRDSAWWRRVTVTVDSTMEWPTGQGIAAVTHGGRLRGSRRLLLVRDGGKVVTLGRMPVTLEPGCYHAFADFYPPIPFESDSVARVSVAQIQWR